MINEREEFCAYTGTVSYTASRKSDTTWLGRFTFATILEFEGMARILTVLARGYLFHSKDGAVVSGDTHDRIDYARRALCAWCSVPEDGKRAPDKKWQFQTDFSELHTEFPELVETPPSSENQLKSQAVEYISSHLDGAASINDISGALHESKAYLSTLFKREMNTTVTDFVTKQRMKEAKKLLLETDMLVSEIYLKVGYQSDKFYIKVLKVMEGETPLAYRKRWK